MKITKILILFALVLSISILTACNKGKSSESGDTSVSGDASKGSQTVVFDPVQETYGNGTSIVNYKGNIYYIEFGNNDYTYESIRIPEYYLKRDSAAGRYVNMMDNRGNIKNLFKVNGVTSLNIIDDRFYLESSGGILHTVDMKGEDYRELARGSYVAFDEENHKVYYQTTNNANLMYSFDTLNYSISKIKFDNPLTSNNYNFLNVKNGKFYYSLLDKRSKELVLFEYDLNEKEQNEVAKMSISLHESEYNNDLVSDFVDNVNSLGNYTAICIGTPVEGTMGGFYDKEIYVFDLQNKTITKTPSQAAAEGDWYSSDDLDRLVFEVLYELNNDSKLPNVHTFVTDVDKELFADKYNFDIDEKLGDEAKFSLAFDEEDSKYVIDIEDYTVVGNNIFYKVTASRANRYAEVGWRPAYVRIASEVYLKNLSTNETKFVYSYVNNSYSQVEESIKEMFEKEQQELSGDALEDSSGEVPTEQVVSGDTASPEPYKEEMMPVDISTASIWKKEFDVRVEEVGGAIFGKRIEYEGHHTKDEGMIRIMVTREKGAMLIVYIDGEESSKMTIE